jgi:poly-gamma-glutamate synthesis protein (capsule biosynthesis protein)
VRLALAGDTMLGRAVADALARRPPQSLVERELLEIVREADLFVLNLECCISERGSPAQKTFTFRAPPAAVETLVHLGVECVTLANNHAGDYGIEALLDSSSTCARRGSPGRARARTSSRRGSPQCSSRAGSGSPS